MIEKQILGQYSQALNSITKKEILDQIEKNHQLDLPKNLIDHEISIMTQSLKSDEKEKHKTNNEKIAKSRIKLGLLLNEYGEKNNLKVSDEEVKTEIQKQIKGMPGQEKMVLDYYQKNPSAAQSLKGSIYEEKIISLIKSKIKLEVKNINIKEAEKIESNSNQLLNYTNIIKKNSTEIKSDIVEHLWKIIISDNAIDQYESNLMRRICGLIYFSDKMCGEIKLKLLKGK